MGGIFVAVLSAVLSWLPVAALAKPFDCVPAVMPPANYRSAPFKGPVRYHWTTARSIRELNSRLTGMAAGSGYCDGPLALTVPQNRGYDIYLPTDVSAACLKMLREHEDAHAKGWEHGDPGSVYHTGNCS